MARPLLDDKLWELIRPLLPKHKRRRRRYPGRKPLDDRDAMRGILFVLKTGIPWEDLPQEMGCGSGMTCWRRLRNWHKSGVWKKLHRLLLNRLRAKGKIDFSRGIVDSSSVRAVFGGIKPAPALSTAGKPGPSTICWSTPRAFRSRPSSPARIVMM
jgi:transposase